MADIHSPTRGQTPDVLTSQTTSALHAAHAPAVPSPLNPEAKRAPVKPPPVREQREKKESLKKRENNAIVRGNTPDVKTKPSKGPTAPSPMRFSINAPSAQQYDAPKDYAWLSHEPTPFITPDGQVELKKPMDQYGHEKSARSRLYANPIGSAQNTKAYRYTHCVADPFFRHKQYYRTSEVAPLGPHMSVEDSDRLIHFDETCQYITNEKGWRTSRANVFAREGSLYYEIKIIRGVPADTIPAPPGGEAAPQPHIRAGWARREAPNDAPVGFDGYSYGITDIRFNTMHRSRPGRICSPQPKKSASKKRKAEEATQQQVDSSNSEQHWREGDVLGLLITLPSISLQRKVNEGIYNPAVDVTDGFADPTSAHMSDVVRDRIPVPYRGNMYFESFEYTISKSMENYSERSPLTSMNAPKPHPNHEDIVMRSLPGSSIRVWLNGKEVGTAFEGLLTFLPPASAMGQGAAPARRELDDGSLGYYPAVSVFAGGIAQVNLGPDWWCPPDDLQFASATSSSTTADNEAAAVDAAEDGQDQAELQREKEAEIKRMPRHIGERYKEQVAEDVVWDIIDEADFFAQDGGFSYVPEADSTVQGAMGRAPGGLLDG